jgi:hypothetical protein
MYDDEAEADGNFVVLDQTRDWQEDDLRLKLNFGALDFFLLS